MLSKKEELPKKGKQKRLSGGEGSKRLRKKNISEQESANGSCWDGHVLVDVWSQKNKSKAFGSQQRINISQGIRGEVLIKLINQLCSDSNKKPTTINLFGKFITVVYMNNIGVMAITDQNPNQQQLSSNIGQPEQSQSHHHLLALWMKHLFIQFENEFSQKLLYQDMPYYEQNQQDLFLFYKQIFQSYSQLKLSEINNNFSLFAQKYMLTLIPYSKAKYLLIRLIIMDSLTEEILFNHSFIEGSARNIDFSNSEHFKDLLESYDLLKGSNNMSKKYSNTNTNNQANYSHKLAPPQTHPSHYNLNANSTNSKELNQELSFGQYILKCQQYKAQQGSLEFKIALIYEKNIKRRLKVDQKTFTKLQQKLNRRYEEQQNRNMKYLEVLEFVRFLFDCRKANPLSQFCNKQQLNELKMQVRMSLGMKQSILSSLDSQKQWQDRQDSQQNMSNMNSENNRSSLLQVLSFKSQDNNGESQSQYQQLNIKNGLLENERGLKTTANHQSIFLNNELLSTHKEYFENDQNARLRGKQLQADYNNGDGDNEEEEKNFDEQENQKYQIQFGVQRDQEQNLNKVGRVMDQSQKQNKILPINFNPQSNDYPFNMDENRKNSRNLKIQPKENNTQRDYQHIRNNSNDLKDQNEKKEKRIQSNMQNIPESKNEVSASFNNQRQGIGGGIRLEALNHEIAGGGNYISEFGYSESQRNQLPLQSKREDLYQLKNETIVTISSIKDFEREKDWLQRQIEDSSIVDSDEEEKLKQLTQRMSLKGLQSTQMSTHRQEQDQQYPQQKLRASQEGKLKMQQFTANNINKDKGDGEAIKDNQQIPLKDQFLVESNFSERVLKQRPKPINTNSIKNSPVLTKEQ